MAWNEPKESSITTNIIRWLNKTYQPDGYAWKIHGGGWSKTGIPDVAFIYKGRIMFFEVKRSSNPDQKGTELQQKKMELLQWAGASCFIVNSKKDVQKIMEGEKIHGEQEVNQRCTKE